MNPGTWIAIYLPFFVLFLYLYHKKKKVRQQLKAKIRRRKGEENEMNAIIEKYMGKGVAATTIDGTTYGKLVSFEEGWITISDKGKEKNLNVDFLVQIEEYKTPEERKAEKQAKKAEK